MNNRHGRSGSIQRSGAKAPLTSLVYQALKKDIIRGSYKAGQALRENELAERYTTSRTPVREAAARLERDGLLRFVPNKGYFVGLISASELTNLTEYRCILECASARMAASREPDVALIQRLESHSRVEYQPGNRRSYVRFIEADTAFHVDIARLTRNQWLVDAITDLRSQIERLLYAAIDVGGFGPLLAREHRKILQAIRKQDANAADALMNEHILGSKQKVLDSL
ncbi:MAG: GntR family transcriptional regulator [Acidobacteria bacterium]|nr:GntR family transcriptional regulator [Acidobacteriota bacterium]